MTTDNGADDGTERRIDRRAVLKSAASVSAVGVGVSAFSGSVGAQLPDGTSSPGDAQEDAGEIGITVARGRANVVVDCPGRDPGGRPRRDRRGRPGNPASAHRPSAGAGPACDVPIGIKGTADFDPVEDLAVGSLRLGVPEVVGRRRREEEGEGEGEGGAEPLHDGHARKVMPYAFGTDPHTDLLVHFPTAGTGLSRDSTELKLVGRTNEGRPVVGTTGVRYRGSGRGSGRGSDR